VPEKQRYAVKQTTYIWAESRNQAARMVRRLQLRPKAKPEYTDFAVYDMVETPECWVIVSSPAYGICIFDEDVLVRPGSANVE
jgi:hypothetical protein